MPRYRFTAVDSYGTAHDGTIDAASEAAARNKLASNGLAVRTVEEVAAPPGADAADVPRRAAPKPSSDGSAVVPRRARPFDAADAPPPRRGSPWPLAFSLLALFVSVGTAVYTLTRRDPTANPLSKYDFSSPEAALLSTFKMEAGGDVLAQMALHQKSISKELRERSETARVDRPKTEDFRGKKILFFEFEQNGTTIKDVVSMERDESGTYRRSLVSLDEVQRSDPQLYQKIARWRTGGVPNPWGGPGGAPGGDKADW